MDGTDFDSRTYRFQAWFQNLPGSAVHPSIQLTDLRSRGEGRGIVASADIPEGTELFIIPRKGVLGVESSELARILPQIFDDENQDNEAQDDNDEEGGYSSLPKPWLDCILVMIYEFLRGEISVWKPYMDVLPEMFDTPMFWSDVELRELQASAVREKIGRESADQMFRKRILPVIRKHQEVFFPLGHQGMDDDALMQIAHRMGSTIMSYAFDLVPEDDREDGSEAGEDGWTVEREEDGAMGMVPMADMLNADAEFNAHLNHGDDFLTMTALRSIQAGEQILNYYGPMPNCEVLRRYGYTTPKHSRYDVVEIAWDSVLTAMEEVLGDRAESLRGRISSRDEEDGLIEDFFVLDRETGDPNEHGQFTSEAVFASFPEELTGQVIEYLGPLLETAPGSSKTTGDQDRLLKRTFLEVMAVVVRRQYQKYDTTIESDEELLRREANSMPARLRMAVDVRLGEKRLLQEVARHVDALLLKYKDKEQENSKNKGRKQRDGMTKSDEPAIKRRKVTR